MGFTPNLCKGFKHVLKHARTDLFLGALVLLASLHLQAETRQLQGHWQKPCENNQDGDAFRWDIQIRGEDWVRTGVGFQKQNCEERYVTYIQKEKAIFSDRGQLDLTFIQAEYVAETQKIADVLNDISYCGKTNWAAGVVVDITGLVCGDMQVPQKGEVVYSQFKEELGPQGQSLLFLGEGSAGAEGTTPEKRYQKFEVLGYEKKESAN